MYNYKTIKDYYLFKQQSCITLILLLTSITLTHTQTLNWNTFLQLPEGTEIAVGVFENGEIATHGFILEEGRLKKKANGDKLFEIGSITKVFTGIATLQTLKKEDIAISQVVSQFLPSSANKISNQLTFQNLLTHTSGLPKMPKNFYWSALRSPGDPFLHYEENNMLRFLYKFKAGGKEQFQYSNLGMGLLGHLCSQIQDASLASIMKKEIFEPLQMEATSMGISEHQFYQVVNPLSSNQYPKNTWRFSEATKGAGNVYSNIQDMCRLLEFILSDGRTNMNLHATILEMEEEQISISDAEGMGLAMRIHKNHSKIMYHGGISYGFKSLMAYNRKQAKGIVILCNAKGLSRKENEILKSICFSYLEEE